MAASRSLRQPSVPMHRDALRYHGDETNLTEGASPGRTESVRAEAPPGSASACVVWGPTLPTTKLKAGVRGAEPRGTAYAGAGREPTADFADFADRGDAAQGCRWRAKPLVRDSTTSAAVLSRSFPSVPSAPSAVISTAWKRLQVEAQLGPGQFCVRLRGLRACLPQLPRRKMRRAPALHARLRISRISRMGETLRRAPGGRRSHPSLTAPCLPPCSPALSYPRHPRHPR